MFHRYPILKILLPLILGIGWGEWAPNSIPFFILISLLIVSFLLLFFSYRKYPYIFWLATTISMICIGYHGIDRQQLLEKNIFPQMQECQIQIEGYGVEKGKTIQYRSSLLSYCTDSVWHRVKDNLGIDIFFSKKDSVDSFQPGEVLFIHASIREIESDISFDYQKYMQHRGVYASAFVDSGAWMKSGVTTKQPKWKYVSKWAHRIQMWYKETGIPPDELAILSAVTIGDKTGLTSELKQNYAVAGVSHVLALSGLHIGLLYAMLMFLMMLVYRYFPLLKIPLQLLALLLLWGYALMVGASASVVRAVLMCTLFTISVWITHRSFSLNTLFVSAFLMLLCKPEWLFDVGFQLSLIAVFSILVGYPMVTKHIHCTTWVGQKVCQLLAVSFVAQIGTAPLILYYFHQFPIHFLWSNLVILPSITILLYLVMMWMGCSLLALPGTWLVTGITWLIHYQNLFIRWINELPFAVMEWQIDVAMMIIGYLMLFLVYRCCSRFSFARCRLFLLTFIVLLCYRIVRPYSLMEQRDKIEFISYRGVPIVHFVPAKATYSNTYYPHANLLGREERLSFINYVYRTKGKRDVLWSDSNDNLLSTLYADSLHLFQMGGQNILLIQQPFDDKYSSDFPLPIDYLYLHNGFQGSIKSLNALFAIRHVVIDSHLSPYLQRKLKAEAIKMSIPVSMLNKKGVLYIDI